MTGMILIYIISQAVCVITSTIKSVITIKGSKVSATLISTFHYALNSLITYLVGRTEELNLFVIIVTSIATNLIGVYVGLLITEKFRKEQLWRVSATVKSEDYIALLTDLKFAGFKFVTFETDWDKVKLIDIFSQGKEQSSKLHEIFDRYDVKYTINNSHYNL